MCTVTFVRSADGVYLTSNRDEHFTRSRAILRVKQGTLLYPEDQDARGSWIALKRNGDAVVLLNGAHTKHLPAPPYRKSRGLILLEVIGDDLPRTYFEQTDLADIEPFTLIIYSDAQLYECRWDGHKKHMRTLDAGIAHIWSSATLYDKAISLKRESWFDEWQQTVGEINSESIIQFHRTAGTGDRKNDLVMERNGIMSTVSITSIHISRSEASLTYIDLKENKEQHETIALTSGELAG